MISLVHLSEFVPTIFLAIIEIIEFEESREFKGLTISLIGYLKNTNRAPDIFLFGGDHSLSVL